MLHLEQNLDDVNNLPLLQSTSQHLHLMKDKGILRSRRDGQTIYYRIANHDTLAQCPLLIAARRLQLNQ